SVDCAPVRRASSILRHRSCGRDCVDGSCIDRLGHSQHDHFVSRREGLMNVSLFRRFARFSIVGAGGIVVQTLALAALLRFSDIHYMLATAVAVELSVLNNLFGIEDGPGLTGAPREPRLRCCDSTRPPERCRLPAIWYSCFSWWVV